MPNEYIWDNNKIKKTSNLSKARETRNSLSSSYSQVVLIYLYPFRRNSLLKSTPQPQIAKKALNLYFKSSRSCLLYTSPSPRD